VPWEKKEKREKLVLKVRRVTWVQKETEVSLDHLESKVLRDLKVLKDQKVPLENLDLLDHLEKREKMDHQVLQGIQEDQGTRVTRELRVEMAHQESKEREVKMDCREKGVKQVQEALEEEWEDLEVLE